MLPIQLLGWQPLPTCNSNWKHGEKFKQDNKRISFDEKTFKANAKGTVNLERWQWFFAASS